MKEYLSTNPKIEKKSDLETFFKGQPPEKEVLSEWNNSTNVPGGESLGLKKRYQKKFGIDNEFEYYISTQEYNYNLEKITFELARDDINISEFTFNKKKKIINNQEQEVWDLEHRLAHAKNEGISGSDIYSWIENYFKILIKNKKIDTHLLFGEISQLRVLNWFLKNNYQPVDNLDLILNRLNDPNLYSLIPIQIKHDNYMKDPYWVPNEIIDPENKRIKC